VESITVSESAVQLKILLQSLVSSTTFPVQHNFACIYINKKSKMALYYAFAMRYAF